MQFAAWYSVHLTQVDDDSHGNLESMHGTLRIFMEMTRSLGPRVTLATPNARTLQALIDFVLGLGAEPVPGSSAPDLADDDDLELGDRVEAMVEVLEHFLDFLVETGSWRASEDEIDASYEVLDAALADHTPSSETMDALFSALLDIEPVPPTVQLQALDALPIIAGVDRLLQWIGRSKPITSTGALRLGDIQAVAALIGINAVGKRGAEDSELSQLLYELATAPTPSAQSTGAEPRPAGSMWQLSELSVWWVALSQAGIINVGATTVRPGSAVASWHAADAAERLAARSDLLDLYVQEWLENEAESGSPSAQQSITRIVIVLAAALSPQLLPGLSSTAIIERAESEFGFGANAAAELSASLVLHYLRRAGLLTAMPADDGTDRLVVPVAVRPALTAVLLPLATAMV